MTSGRSEEDFKMLWDVITSISRQAMMIPEEDVKALEEVVSRSEALGPLLEPTMYIRGGRENLEDQKSLLRGLRAMRKAVQEVADRKMK